MHLKREKYLLGGTARYFRQRRISKAKAKAKQAREKRAQFRKGFLHKSSQPKSFDVKPMLPTRGKSRFGSIKRRVRRIF